MFTEDLDNFFLDTSDSDDSSNLMSWDVFDELDAILHDSPPSVLCDNFCTLCMSSSIANHAQEPRQRTELLPTEYSSEQLLLDRLFQEPREKVDDLVLLGQSLSSGEPNTYMSSTPHQLMPNHYTPTFQDWFNFEAPPSMKPVPQVRQSKKGRRGQQTSLPEEEKIFPCPYAGCTRVYSKNSHLRAHLRRHTGEKPFVCQWPGCKWRFSRSDELARHKRSHSGIKPYQCPVCAKRFGRSDHLAKHVRIHRKQGYIVPPPTRGKGAAKLQVFKTEPLMC